MVARREERRAERVLAEVPVRIKGTVVGTTRNMSATGVYFLTDRDIAAGQVLRFVLDLDSPGGLLTLVCSGTVVRIDDSQGKRGVAVHLESSYLKRKI